MQRSDERCDRCGLCMDLCRFDAIEGYKVDFTRCEGFALCFRACPKNAVEMVSEVRGKVYVSRTRYCPFVYATLEPGEENSCLLVHTVKDTAERIQKMRGYNVDRLCQELDGYNQSVECK